MTILVFPSSVDISLTFAQSNRENYTRIIGASSVDDDPHAQFFDHWERVPYIHEGDFSEKLKKLIKTHDIKEIYTPHAPSYLRLEEILCNLGDVILKGESPYDKQMQLVRNALNEDSLFLASLIRHANTIYGECSAAKIRTLFRVFNQTPRGDVVEIGTFFGKSAYVLNRLAAYYNIGATLAIDPWQVDHSIQKKSPDAIQKLATLWNWELVFQGFLLNLKAVYVGAFNYLRLPSQQAWDVYTRNHDISSSDFGTTTYKGKIAVLHLDGNHDLASVQQDFDLWSQAIAPGGWILFDDYEWSQGDGPRQVADRIRHEWADRIDEFFVDAGTAFIKLKE